MKRFLFEFAKFSAIQMAFLSLFLGLFYGVNFTNDPMAAIVDKERRIKETPGERIIIVGDSGAPFGIVSPMIGDAFPGYHPLNSGLAAGFGHRVLLGEVAPDIHPGDIVIICFVYELFVRNQVNAFIFPISSHNFDVFWSLDHRDLDFLGTNGFMLVKTAMRHARRVTFDDLDKPFPGPYARNSYNEYGDIVDHYGLPTPEGRSLSIKQLDFGNFEYARDVIGDLNRFAAEAREKGATVYFLFPAISEQSYDDHGPAMEAFADIMESELDFPVLNRPGDSVFPESMFYDTSYHLSGEGAHARTAQLIEALQEREE
ncbi:MAG: hypothetical protein ACQKBV_11225 [Puniceicoccales bacterium]